MTFSIEQALRQLIALPSVNPMGGAADMAVCYEHRVTAWLEDFFQRLGLPTRRQRVEEVAGVRRENILCRLDGDDSQPLLLWEVHQDTVPVADMTIDPFAGEVRDGRLYGRGACDVKGGMVAMLAALERLARQRPTGRSTVVLACTVNEEFGFSGARRLADSWRSPETDAFLPRAPDACIVAEPTDLNVVVAHKGAVRWRMRTSGRAAHSSQPERGDNAIYKAGRLIQALEQYQGEIVGDLAHDDLCGRPTLVVSTIRGGVGINLVPEQCMLEIDRRLVPGESPTQARKHLIDWLASRADLDFPIQHDEPFMVSAGLARDKNAGLAGQLAAHAAAFGGGGQLGVPYGTDAESISAAGVPTVVFGPGSITQAHTADEWIELAEVEQAAEILYRLACAFA